MTPAGASLRIVVGTWRSPGHPAAGGAELFAWEVARGLAAAGHDVTLIGGRAPGQARQERREGVRLLRRGGLWTAYPRMWWYLLTRRRSYDAVVDCQSGLSMMAPLFAGDRPVVHVTHHVHQEQFGMYFPRPVAALGRWLEGPIARRVYRHTITAAVSQSTADEMRQRLRWLGPIEVVHNGTPQPTGTGERSRLPLVLVLGRLVRHKRVPAIVDAMPLVLRRRPDARLVVVGDGDDADAVRAAVDRSPVSDRIEVTGRVNEDEKEAWLAAAWLTVSASTREGWGLALMEAAAGGVPAVAVNAPGIRDAVQDGRTGWLVDSVADLGPAIAEAIDLLADPESANEWADNCKEWSRGFTWSNTVAEIESLLLAVRLPSSGDQRPQRRAS